MPFVIRCRLVQPEGVGYVSRNHRPSYYPSCYRERHYAIEFSSEAEAYTWLAQFDTVWKCDEEGNPDYWVEEVTPTSPR